jgi:DNA-binding CsgD family transcriptional regulator
LLERAEELSRLEQCLDLVVSESSGMVVLVGGEAGVGKTSLLRCFCERRDSRTRLLLGGCEPLLASRPLGPFIDLAEMPGGELEELVTGAVKPHAVATGLLRDLRNSGPSIVILEDLHWADEGTLDVVRLTARRLGGVGALLVISYRDDELGPWHPLRILIGELGANQRIVRIRLTPLSLDAVAALAAPLRADAVDLYRRTGGNPFFVTELLAAGDSELPASVSDAVLARAGRLQGSAREVVEAAAIAGPAAELWLTERLVEGASERLDECLASGIVVGAGEAISFRHELAREAIVSAISDHRKLALHRAVLEALSSPPSGEPDLARLAHHAVGAADAAAVLQFVPAAAERASALGAHREAAVLYDWALRFAAGAPLEARATLFERRAAECYYFTDFASAERAQRKALECYEQLGDELRQGAALSWLSQLVWEVGSLPDAKQIALEATAQLERLPVGRELVGAYCQVAQLLIAAEDPDGARAWAARASELASQIGRKRPTVVALMTLGWAEFFAGESSGLAKLKRCLEIAESCGLHEDVATTHVVITRTAARRRMYDLAELHVHAGLDYCDGRDFDVFRYYLVGWQAKLALARGRWNDAAPLAEILLAEPCPMSRIHGLVALGLLRARRGDPDPWTLLDEALAIALPRKELQWIAPVATARAEAAWLEGRHDAIAPALEPALGFPMRIGDPYASALVYWRWRAGIDVETPTANHDDPCLLETAGDWAGASDAWRMLGCPYESALALAAADDEQPLRRALDELRALSARPAAAIVARRLRERGARGLPRGPRPGTRQNPAGLTARELEVVTLLAEGLRNAQIAERLVVAEKTVGHHVSSILRKLDVRTRGEAGAQAARLGLTAPR